jgi:hypothetical protein
MPWPPSSAGGGYINHLGDEEPRRIPASIVFALNQNTPPTR